MDKAEQKAIFVSHAAVDRDIADKVVDLLNMAMGINVAKEVFCTSLEGLKIPAGKDFKEFIKDQIQNPKIVLLLISRNYLASQFCLAEVGASWALSHNAIPFLVPPVEHKDMKAVLSGTQAFSVVDPSGWNEALEIFRQALGIDPNVSRWERKRDEKIAEIKSLLPSQHQPKIVPYQKYVDLQTKLEDANEEIAILEEENGRLKELLEKVKKAKDAKEVAKVELEGLPANVKFQKLVSAAKLGLKPLPDMVCEAIYFDYRDEAMPWPTAFGNEYDVDKIKEAIRDGWLYDDEPNGIRIRSDDPKIRRATDALDKLSRFVENADEKEPEFFESYSREYDHNLEFTSRRFWNAHLL